MGGYVGGILLLVISDKHETSSQKHCFVQFAIAQQQQPVQHATLICCSLFGTQGYKAKYL